MRQPEARRLGERLRVLRVVCCRLRLARALGRVEAREREPHQLDEMAADDHVTLGEAEAPDLAFDGPVVALAHDAEEVAEADEALAYQRVTAVEAARERLAMQDLLVDRVADERRLGAGGGKGAVRLRPVAPKLLDLGSRERDASGARYAVARLEPGTRHEEESAEHEEVEPRRVKEPLHRFGLRNPVPSSRPSATQSRGCCTR